MLHPINFYEVKLKRLESSKNKIMMDVCTHIVLSCCTWSTQMDSPLPLFHCDWESEFAKSNSDMWSLRVFSLFTALFLNISVACDCIVFDSFYLPKFLSAVLVCTILVHVQTRISQIRASPSCQGRSWKNYNILCSIVVITIYLNISWHQQTASTVEFKTQLFIGMHCIATENQTCNFGHIAGHLDNNSPNILPSCCSVLVCLLPLILKMSPISVIFVTLAELVILIVSSTLRHFDFTDLFLAVFLQTSAGLSAVHISRSRLRVAREHFALAKAAKFASEQTSNRLHTLIPMQVLPALASHTGKEMLGALIPHCTVMFCSLHLDPAPSMSLADNHRLLDRVFSALDEAVSRSGMFKYQHVGEWYIVACPRAAAPFDTELQERPYPADHVSAMLRLATELQVLSIAVSAGDRKQRC